MHVRIPITSDMRLRLMHAQHLDIELPDVPERMTFRQTVAAESDDEIPFGAPAENRYFLPPTGDEPAVEQHLMNALTAIEQTGEMDTDQTLNFLASHISSALHLLRNPT